MTRIGRFPRLGGGAVMGLVLAACLSFVGFAQSADGPAARELDARRLFGAAHYENGDFKTAAKEFRRCIELAPDSAADRFNLALVLLRATQYKESLESLDEAQRLALYQEVERRIVAQAPVVFTSHGISAVLVNPELEGYVLTPIGVPQGHRVMLRRD